MVRDITSEIERLEREIEEKHQRIKALSELFAAYPDLQVHVDKKDSIRYVSKSMNEYVTTIDIAQTCACCDGAPLLVWCYTVVEGVRVYSDPPHFEVGWLNPNGFGTIPRSDWKEHMRKAGANKAVIEKVENYLRKHLPVDYTEK